MASHRKPRPGGTGGPGLRTPALATAALTSVAVLSQTAGTAHADDGRPSLEEIEKKVDELYRRADSATERPEEATERADRQRGRPDALRGKALSADAPQEHAERPPDYFAQNRLMDRLASTVKKRQETTRSLETPVAPPAVPPVATTLVPPVAPPAVPPVATTLVPPVATTLVPPAATAPVSPITPPLATPAATPHDPKSAKAAVQRKLASARELLSRPTAPEQVRQSTLGQWPQEEAGTPSYGSSGAQATKAEKAIAFARAQIGKPYVNGASGPGSYDCAGLIQAAWRAAGVTLPRTARDQAAAGTAVSLADAHPGDLVFFHDDHSHVGLCTGDGMMIHSPRPGAYIREESVHHGGESIIRSVVRPA
ncbi:C40 family peptidase [Streptomyces sp. NPDC101151]|uniref:C40 family peptidase n=1 Tax=Streptomyces sp. NPDC101151 TaxID=3366115 RepID=UPI00380BF4FF